MEPLNYWCMDSSVTCSLMEEWRCAGSLDFSADAGVRALQHILMQRPYVGVTWSSLHSELLLNDLNNRVFALMLDPESSLYEPQLQKLLSESDSNGDTTENPSQKPGKKRVRVKKATKTTGEHQDEENGMDNDANDEGGKDTENDPDETPPTKKKKKTGGKALESSASKEPPSAKRNELLSMIKELKGKDGPQNKGAKLFFDDEAEDSDGDE